MATETYISLLSGGLDSVVNLFLAKRAAFPEIKAAKHFTSKLDIPHEVIAIPWLATLTNTALVNKGVEIPQIKDLDDLKEGKDTASKVWVPNRNGVFLNIAASYAESLGAQYIVPGFNKEEAATFPDNSQAFIDISNKAFALSTLTEVKVKCFTTNLDKVQMAQQAVKLGIDLKKLWSCYESGDDPCLKCESCRRTTRALEVMGI
jgi:7-cyano-7-deazaguanine synthase